MAGEERFRIRTAVSSGRTASVPSCTNCTYAWQITGGTINTATNISAITSTPNSSSETLTATITAQKGCGITVSKVLATSCGAVTAPTNVVATATSATAVQVTWSSSAGAATYNVYRSTDNTNYSLAGNTASTTFSDTGRTASTAYMYRVRAVNGGESSDSNKDFAVTMAYTDSTITAQSTTVKAAHFTQLRTAVNALRTLNGGQSAFVFTDSTLNSTIQLKAVHLTQLRTELNTVRAALGFSTVTFTTDPTITATTTTLKKAHIDELRAGAQ